MDLSSQQKEILKQFITKVSDIRKPGHDDRYMQRWLNARKFDIKKAEEMFRKSMAWREEMGADTILQDWEPPEIMQKYYPGGILGRDREGNIIFLDPFGNIDLKGIMMSVKKCDILKSMVYRCEMIERLRLQGTTPEKPIHHCLHIQDLSGFSTRIMFRAGLNLAIEILRMLEDNYPEMLKKTFIINAPKIFTIGYNVIKNFINKDTAAKFQMLDGDWQSTILKVIDPDQLPVYYGGKMVDDHGDQKCSQIICYGGEVPSQHYRKMDNMMPEGSKVLKKNIAIRNTFNHELLVPTTNCIIKWMFTLEKGDLVFSVLQDVYGTLQPVEGPRTIPSSLVPEEGLVHCDQIGKYTLRFVNPSFVTPKKLNLYAEVLDVEGAKLDFERTYNKKRQSDSNVTSL